MIELTSEVGEVIILDNSIEITALPCIEFSSIAPCRHRDRL